MNKTFLALFSVIATFMLTSPAQAMFWQSAEITTPRTYEVGGVGQLYFDPSEFMGYVDFVAGIDPRLSLEARLGDGGAEFYAGGFAKYALFSREGFSFSFFGGIYTQGNGYVEIAPMGTYDLGRADLYFGPDFALTLGDRSSISTFNIGISIPYERRFSIFGELDIKLSNIPTSVLAGMRARF